MTCQRHFLRFFKTSAEDQLQTCQSKIFKNLGIFHFSFENIEEPIESDKRLCFIR